MGTIQNFRERVSNVVVDLNNRLSDGRSGSLVQIWIPERTESGVVLQTQGLPYAVAGTGDLLALFRCISCRYHFSTDVLAPKLLGAVGRVYTTLEPEMCTDVQKYNRQIYLRVNEAQRCRVHSTLVMPFFDSPSRESPLGVVEIVKNAKHVSFNELVHCLAESLSSVKLYSADLDSRTLEVGLRRWPLHVDVSLMEFSNKKALLEDVGEEVSGTTGAEGGKQKKTRVRDTEGVEPVDEIEEVESTDQEKERSQERGIDEGTSLAQPKIGKLTSPNNALVLGGNQEGQRPGPEAGHGQQVAGVLSNTLPFPFFPSTPLSGNQQIQTITPGPFPNGAQPVSSSTFMNSYHSTMVPGTQLPSVMGIGNVVPVPPNAGIPTTPHMGPAVGPGAVGNFPNSVDMAQAVQHYRNLATILHELQSSGRKRKFDGKRSKTAMGTGRHLTFEDLKAHMNVGLKEAAARLNICPTTLKRACRRVGITRWPCRQIAKLTKTMTDMGYKGPPPNDILEMTLKGQLSTSNLSKELSSAGLQPGTSEPVATGACGGSKTAAIPSSGEPSSAPAALTMLSDEVHQLGSGSSQGLLSMVLSDQELHNDEFDVDDDVDDLTQRPSTSQGNNLKFRGDGSGSQFDQEVGPSLFPGSTSMTLFVDSTELLPEASASLPMNLSGEKGGGNCVQGAADSLGPQIYDFMVGPFDPSHLDMDDEIAELAGQLRNASDES